MDSPSNAIGAVSLASKARSYGQWLYQSAQSAASSASGYVEEQYAHYEQGRDTRALAAHDTSSSTSSSQWSSKLSSAASQARDAAVRGWESTTNAYKGSDSEDHLSNVLKQYHMDQNMDNGPNGARRAVPGWLAQEEQQRRHSPPRANSAPARPSDKSSSLRDIYDSYSHNSSSSNKSPSRPRPQQQRSLPSTGSGASDRLRRMKEESAARYNS